jgi:hypothetical protein
MSKRGYRASYIVSEAIEIEQKTGMRFCTMCNKQTPLSEFDMGKRIYKCEMHYKELKRHYMLGTVPKKAYNSIRCRAYQDMHRLFDQKSMHLSSKQILVMLTEDRLESYVKYCLIPRDPTQPLDVNNSVIVTTIQRSYVVAGWKAMHDSAKYSSDLEFILSTQNTDKIKKN